MIVVNKARAHFTDCLLEKESTMVCLFLLQFSSNLARRVDRHNQVGGFNQMDKMNQNPDHQTAVRQALDDSSS